MIPQKQKNYASKRTVNKWKGCYIDDISCNYCLHWKGKNRGCSLPECGFEEKKLDTIKSGRINRKRGIL